MAKRKIIVGHKYNTRFKSQKCDFNKKKYSIDDD